MQYTFCELLVIRLATTTCSAFARLAASVIRRTTATLYKKYVFFWVAVGHRESIGTQSECGSASVCESVVAGEKRKKMRRMVDEDDRNVHVDTHTILTLHMARHCFTCGATAYLARAFIIRLVAGNTLI